MSERPRLRLVADTVEEVVVAARKDIGSLDRKDVVAAAIILKERYEDVTPSCYKDPARWSSDTNHMALIGESRERENLNLKTSKRMRLSPKVGGELGVPYHNDRRSSVSHGPQSRRQKLQFAKDPIRAADMLTNDVVEGFGTRVTRRCCSIRGPVHHVNLTVKGMTTLRE